MAYRHWTDKLTQAIRFALPESHYVKIHSENLVGLMTCIFVKASEKENLRGLDITTVKRYVHSFVERDTELRRLTLVKVVLEVSMATRGPSSLG